MLIAAVEMSVSISCCVIVQIFIGSLSVFFFFFDKRFQGVWMSFTIGNREGWLEARQTAKEQTNMPRFRLEGP